MLPGCSSLYIPACLFFFWLRSVLMLVIQGLLFVRNPCCNPLLCPCCFVIFSLSPTVESNICSQNSLLKAQWPQTSDDRMSRWLQPASVHRGWRKAEEQPDYDLMSFSMASPNGGGKLKHCKPPWHLPTSVFCSLMGPLAFWAKPDKWDVGVKWLKCSEGAMDVVRCWVFSNSPVNDITCITGKQKLWWLSKALAFVPTKADHWPWPKHHHILNSIPSSTPKPLQPQCTGVTCSGWRIDLTVKVIHPTGWKLLSPAFLCRVLGCHKTSLQDMDIYSTW